jgi:hypothetical protein
LLGIVLSRVRQDEGTLMDKTKTSPRGSIRASHGCVYLTGVYLTGVRPTGGVPNGMHLIGIRLKGIYFMSTYLTGMYLTCAYLMGMHLTGGAAQKAGTDGL